MIFDQIRQILTKYSPQAGEAKKPTRVSSDIAIAYWKSACRELATIPFRNYFPTSQLAILGQNLSKSPNRNRGYADEILKDSAATIINLQNRKPIPEWYI